MAKGSKWRRNLLALGLDTDLYQFAARYPGTNTYLVKYLPVPPGYIVWYTEPPANMPLYTGLYFPGPFVPAPFPYGEDVEPDS